MFSCYYNLQLDQPLPFLSYPGLRSPTFAYPGLSILRSFGAPKLKQHIFTIRPQGDNPPSAISPPAGRAGIFMREKLRQEIL